MGRMFTGWLGVVLVATTTAVGVWQLAGGIALGDSACPDATRPQLAASLTDLQQAIGSAMGSPVECPRVDVDGNLVQETTTGVALHRAGGMSLFASGERRWALTGDQGLQTWTSSWHAGLFPPSASTAAEEQQEPSSAPAASVAAWRLVRVRPDASNMVELENRVDGMVIVEVGSGCADVVAAVGDNVFIRTGGQDADLILLAQHETCPVADMRPAERN